MHKHFMSGLLLAALCAPIGALAETTLDLTRGHFFIEFDPAVPAYTLRALPKPGACLPELALEQQSDTSYRLVNKTPACRTEAIAELRLNPAWSSALHIQLAGGQLDFGASLWDSLQSLRATVSVGDIFGPDGVQRYRLLGARLELDQPRSGLQLRVSVGAGQIDLAMPARHPLAAQ